MIRRRAALAAIGSALGLLSLAPAAPAQTTTPEVTPRPSGSAAGWLRIPDATRARYAREIRESAERHGVSQDLVEAVIQVESAFNPRAVSPKGAQGLMQLMPLTASALGVRNAFDPQQNIDGGVRHLRNLLARYPNDLARALAAYNAGEGAVDLHGGIPPFAETQRYVQRVIERQGGARAAAPVVHRVAAAAPAPAPAPPRREATVRSDASALPATPMLDEARRAGRLPMGSVERAEREPIRAMLTRLRQEGAEARTLPRQGATSSASSN